MRNLLIFLNPVKGFYNWYEALCKIQIENGILMGWKPKDILLVTNFPYEYIGIKAMEVDDSLYCVHRKRATKINVILDLIDKGVLDGISWFHDFDAHQVQPLTEEELGMNGFDLAMTDYGYCPKSNTASFFFKPESRDIMLRVKEETYRSGTNEETGFNVVRQKNSHNVNKRCKFLNCTYSIGIKGEPQYQISYEKATKPLKVININPRYPIYEGFKPHMSSELLAIFKRHGFE